MADENDMDWNDTASAPVPPVVETPKTETKPEPKDDWGVDDSATVKVRCVVDSFPFTDRKGLKNGEEAVVPVPVAKTMLKNKQVVIA